MNDEHDNEQTDRETLRKYLTADDVRDTMASLAPGLHPDLKPITGRLFNRADLDQWKLPYPPAE